MTSGQRLLLALFGIALAGYLVVVGLMTTRGAEAALDAGGPASGESAEKIDPAPVITDMPERLAAAGIILEPYRHGVVSQSGAQIDVARNGEDGFGVFFRPQNLTRTIIIPFNATGDARVIVRTTTEGNRAYQNAAPGDFMRLTPGTEEVLIFTDEANAIKIALEGFVDCASEWNSLCADGNYLAEQIGLNQKSSGNPEDDLLIILDWVANNIVWSSDRAFTAEGNELVKRYSAAQMYASVYEPETGSGYCGASAVFLSKVLNELGYTAFTINIGTSQELSHVTTLIYNPFGDQKFYMMDPTFNAVFKDRSTGAWVPMEELLEGDTEGVELASRPVEDRRFMTQREFSTMTDCRPSKGRPDVLICFRPGYGFETYIQSFSDAFEDAGMSADADGYMALLRHTYFSVGNQAGDDVRSLYLALLSKNNISVER